MEKETPEETYNRCYDIIAKQEYDRTDLWDDEIALISYIVSDLYFTERLKIEVPTDAEIKEYSTDSLGKHEAFMFSCGAKWMRKLLTGI